METSSINNGKYKIYDIYKFSKFKKGKQLTCFFEATSFRFSLDWRFCAFLVCANSVGTTSGFSIRRSGRFSSSF